MERFSISLITAAPASAKSLQSCPSLCNPVDGSPPGSPIPGILQARTLEWVAISFSSAGKWKVKVKSLSRVRLLATPWSAAHLAPLQIKARRYHLIPIRMTYYWKQKTKQTNKKQKTTEVDEDVKKLKNSVVFEGR